MKPVSFNKIYKFFKGTDLPLDRGKMITHVTTDSRQAGPGCLFVALKGEKFDGHDFVNQVFENGAEAVVLCGDRVDEIKNISDKIIITVPDTLIALGQLASFIRNDFNIPVLGITGSVGKTSTKDLTACAFTSLGNIAKTKLNYNNEIGLPMTIFSVEENDRALIGEMGMRGLGEIEYLTQILKPDIGIITNIGISHIERLGSRKNIMLAKTEICYGMPEGSSLLVFHGDRADVNDEITKEKILERIDSFNKNIQVKFFGLSPQCDYWADHIQTEENGNSSFDFNPGKYHIKLNVAGVHNVNNATAALAAACIYGIPIDQAILGVENFHGDRVRQNIIQSNGITIIDDTYNAAPESMEAALSVLGTLPGIGRKIAVLGSMLELGAASDKAHQDVCQAAERNGVEILIAVGDTWGQSMDQCNIKQKAVCSSWKEAIHILKDFCGDRAGKMGKKGDGFLVKGSHAMQMSKIVKVLVEGEIIQ